MNLLNIAIDSLADQADLYPPAGWAEEFDAAHDYVPRWALGSDKPHERFIAHARGGHPNLMRQFQLIVARWLATHPTCPELQAKLAEVRAAWDARDADPAGWAPYLQYIPEEVVL